MPNGVLSCLNRNKREPICIVANGRPVDMQKCITYEHLTLNRKTESQGLAQVEFGLPGDTGSLLVNRFGEFCGLYYGNATLWIGLGGEDARNSTAGLAMSIEKVKRRISIPTWVHRAFSCLVLRNAGDVALIQVNTCSCTHTTNSPGA